MSRRRFEQILMVVGKKQVSNDYGQLLYNVPLQAMLRPILQEAEAEDGFSVGNIWLLDLQQGR